MLARTSGRLLTQTSFSAAAKRPFVRLAVPTLTRTLLTARGFTTTLPALNAAQAEATSSSEEISHFRRIEYMRNETAGPSQESIISNLKDDRIANLSFVIRANKEWRPAPSDFPLPRRDRPDRGEKPHQFAEFLYNTFNFETVPHLKRFHMELARALDGRFRIVNAISLLDCRSKTVTVGLPAFIGIQPPYPAKDNAGQIMDLLNTYRSKSSSAEEKSAAAKELRKYVVPGGFKNTCHTLNLYVFTLYDSIRKTNVKAIEQGTVAFTYTGRARDVIGSASADEGSDVAEQSSRTGQKQRSKGSRDKGKGRAAGVKNESTAANGSKSTGEPTKLSADDPKLPEAGTFVVQGGDKHKSREGVDKLQEHVPFPTPNAEEMGIKKPTETGADLWTADNPKLPEAGTFVAQDGDKHEPSEGVDRLQEHVPFPTPSAEEMGMKKPTES